jgi:transposase
MNEATTYVGLDVHKDSIQVAMLLPGSSKPQEWGLEHSPSKVTGLLRRLRRRAPGPVVCCYEAGPCGYELQRRFEEGGVSCKVIAPSLIPKRPGQRVKTDKRDARGLAEFLRAGLLTEVRTPTAEEESLRDLCRAREDAKEDQLRARHRLSKFLLRQGRKWGPGRKNWTMVHHAWLRQQVFHDTPARVVFEDYLRAVEHAAERIRDLDTAIEEMATREPYAERVGWLRCFRGISTVTAVSLVAELHGFERFSSPRALMGFLGLVPSEHSSGGSRRQGSITKAGNSHVRRLLVESAWHYRHKPHVGLMLRRRREGQPGWVVAVADKAQHRLHRRYCRLSARGKPRNKVTVAVARELVGFVWSVLHEASRRDASQAA